MLGVSKAYFCFRRYSHDELQGESNSISNQKQMLEDFARRNGLPNPTHFTEDGISGTRFARPGFLAIMEEVEAGRVEAIVIKDGCVIIEPTQKGLENQGFVAGSICF
ncbi:MAG: recombinase family protein [Ruminococcus sp.]|nr:recombinase family protein [Ruminococcus sp.]